MRLGEQDAARAPRVFLRQAGRSGRSGLGRFGGPGARHARSKKLTVRWHCFPLYGIKFQVFPTTCMSCPVNAVEQAKEASPSDVYGRDIKHDF